MAEQMNEIVQCIEGVTELVREQAQREDVHPWARPGLRTAVAELEAVRGRVLNAMRMGGTEIAAETKLSCDEHCDKCWSTFSTEGLPVFRQLDGEAAVFVHCPTCKNAVCVTPF